MTDVLRTILIGAAVALLAMTFSPACVLADENSAVYFEQLWKKVYEADSDTLPTFEEEISDAGVEKLSAGERVRLNTFVAKQYSKLLPESALVAAEKVLNDDIFRMTDVDAVLSRTWCDAIEIAFASSSGEERNTLVRDVRKNFESAKQSWGFQLAKLDFLIKAYNRLGETANADTMVQDKLPLLLESIPEYPDWHSLYGLWRLERTLEDARALSELRLATLRTGQHAVERHMKRRPIEIEQFPNLWRFRVGIAKIRSERGDSADDVLAMLDGMDSFAELQIKAMREQLDNPEPHINRFHEFNSGNRNSIKNIAESIGLALPDEWIGKMAPEFDASTLNGKQVGTQKFRGRVLVIDFWAVWCGPCIKAFPDLQKLDELFPDERVMLIGVTQKNGYRWNGKTEKIQEDGDATREEEIEALKNFVGSHGLKFPQVMDEAGIVEKFNIKGWPTTFVIDKKGVVRFIGLTFNPIEFENLVSEIEMLLEE